MENYSVTQAFAFHHRNVTDFFFFLSLFFLFQFWRFSQGIRTKPVIRLICRERPLLNMEGLAIIQWHVVQSGTVAALSDRHCVIAFPLQSNEKVWRQDEKINRSLKLRHKENIVSKVCKMLLNLCLPPCFLLVNADFVVHWGRVAGSFRDVLDGCAPGRVSSQIHDGCS